MNVLAATLVLLAATVHGTVKTDGVALPGCTVTLESSSPKREAVTDAEGTYRIEGVAPGEYRLKFALSGLGQVERTIRIGHGDSLEDATLEVPQVGEVTTNCRPCSDDPPETVWDYPACDDEDLDVTLVANIERGDPSAIALAQRRHAAATTYAQKHSLAAALLGRVPDDTRYWNELYEHARNLVEQDQKLAEWCEKQGLPAQEYRWMAEVALAAVGEDPRSRTLLLKALQSDDFELVRSAVYGFMDQRDDTALPAVAKALARFPDNASSIAQYLAWWRSEAADEIAFRYLDEEQRAEYREVKREVPQP